MTAAFARLFRRKEFDLRLWFVAVSLAAILVVNTLSALLLSRYVAQGFIDREGEVAREFLTSIISAEHSGPHLFDKPGPSPALQSFSGHVQKLPGVVRANIYAPDFFIRYSTNKGLIGLQFTDNEELREAFEGRIIASLEEAEEANVKSEHIALDLPAGEEFIEAYIPVSDDAGKVVAVVEFYRNSDALRSIISKLTITIWASAVLAGMLLFAALYGAVARGSFIIDRQKREIGDMAALAALGQMASAVAHSLRNPLAGIRSSAELLRLQHGSGVAEATDDILGEVDRMNQHVHELLDYARSDKGAGQRLNLSHFIRRLLAKNEPRLARHGIATAFRVERKAAEVVIDPMMFNQAFTSIITNAAEAMPGGGRLDITLRSAPRPGMIELIIADTGTGIAPEVLAQLPAPFVTTKTRGLGLGLTLARRIVERFGGSLTLASRQGEGTTVAITLRTA